VRSNAEHATIAIGKKHQHVSYIQKPI
jgi:hypothetical protein